LSSKVKEFNGLSRDQLSVLQFTVLGALCCVDLTRVNKVFPLVALKAVPSAPPYVAGVMNLHGRAVPVIDLAMRLSLPNTQPYTLDTPIVLVAAGAREYGLIVQEILEVETLKVTQVSAEKLFAAEVPSFVNAINTARGLSLLIDVERLLDFATAAA